MLTLILLLLSVICLGLAAFGVSLTNRVSLGWLGLFLFVLTFLIDAFASV